ncbi:MAG: F0F1 ATP synthase subunit B [Candidatus Omnitrophica bacterium]|nr:F0F1 ATP synthase subunit B [Candidatus Omnitrophota bacterium]MCA9431611.1 F0F1 ATP synthase subunit B [Candidatus Omnitrophota bacterium]MCB9768014.1 F0F1 ATP synthase subunit B [Candidatus Omnitrophota bacterium]MCB9782833.1 F0F1 ATP synthase subunit B [Candidatus Omnitrophota bacterium]
MDVWNLAWFGCHVVLFVILVFALKKWAFGPVTNLLDERSKSIADQFAEMERMKADAAKMQEEYKTQLQQAQAEARETVRRAQDDAARAAEQMRTEAQAQLEKTRKEAQERIAHETEMAKAELRKYVADLSVLAAEKFLTEGLTESQRKSLVDSTLPEVERTISNN